MENSEKNIASCLDLVEDKLSRGKRSTWDANDFRILSNSIKEDTGTLLSVSTLKRISGKANYHSNPSSTTLDALARYVGFKDWRAFLVDIETMEVDKEVYPENNLRYKYLLPLLLVGAALSAYFLFSVHSGDAAYREGDFSFDGKSVTAGLPNSVVFEYDASAADENARIEIQQDWDEKKRVIVDKNDSVLTSIYYRPGFFQSKLVVDDSIVAEKDILIPTQDWLGVVESDSVPLYLRTEDIHQNGALVITPEMLSEFNVNPSISIVAAGFYQVRDFGDLYVDDFEMSVSVINKFKNGVSVCQRVQIMILYEGGMLMLLLGNKGCISELALYGFNKMIDGKKNDLSGLGVDFDNYADVKCVSKNQNLDILVNGNSAYSFDVPASKLKIVGVVCLFEGAGALKNVEFKKGNEVVYTSKF